MKITHNKVGQNLNLTDTGKGGKAEKAGDAKNLEKAGSPKAITLDTKDTKGGNSASKVELSNRAIDMKRIKEVATATPDIDEAKVAKFQKLIDEGKYEVDAESVADKMVDEHILYS